VQVSVTESRWVAGIRDNVRRSAMRWWEVTALYGPATGGLLVGGFVSRSTWWSLVATSLLVFVLFAGTGLTLSARAARR
jgi:hypothetical protein